MKERPRRGRRKNERGHLMAAVMLAVALLSIFSATAVQEYSQVLRRDNEAEMIFRAQEIVRAIQRYRRANGAAPLKLEQLMEPGPQGQYFLRQLYEDPLVPDGKWGLLFVGPGNTVVDPNAEEDPNAVPGAGGLGQGGFGQSPFGQSPFGQGGQGQGGQGGFNQGPSGQAGTQQGRRVGSGFGGRSKAPGRGRQGGGFGAGSGPGGFGGAAGQQEGLPIAGVKSLCTDKPFRLYNGLPEYKQWLFTYFDLERPQVPGQGPGGRQRPGVGNTGRGAFGNSGGAGSRGGFGNNPQRRPGSRGSAPRGRTRRR